MYTLNYITLLGGLKLQQGYHGDTSKTFFCGEVDEGFKRLVKVVFFFFTVFSLQVHGFCFNIVVVVGLLFCKVTEECLEKGIAVCKDGASFKKIGKRIR